MKTILYFENEEISLQYNVQAVKQIRQFFLDDTLVMISAGDFSSGGYLLQPCSKDRAEEYVKTGADLVLSLPAASVLGGYGKKEFAGAALVQRLRTVDQIIIPCLPLPGQSVKDCEKALRACAMLMFEARPDYRSRLNKNLADNMPFREAQLKAVCACAPDGEILLSNPENRQALWLLDSLLQLYYMANVEFIIAPEFSVFEEIDDNTSQFEKNVAAKTAGLLNVSSREQLIDIAGSTSQMVADLFENKELVRASGSFEEITKILLPASAERTRLFILKAILGVRKIYMQICGLHVFVPYCYVSAKNDNKRSLLKQLEKSSWVPFIGDRKQEQNMDKDYFYLLQIDKSAEDLILGKR